MSRPSRDPHSAATVHEMSSAARAQYERVKAYDGVKGWATPCDPWAWSNAKADDAWPGRATQNPGLWPPAPKPEEDP